MSVICCCIVKQGVVLNQVQPAVKVVNSSNIDGSLQISFLRNLDPPLFKDQSNNNKEVNFVTLQKNLSFSPLHFITCLCLSYKIDQIVVKHPICLHSIEYIYYFYRLFSISINIYTHLYVNHF